MSSEESGVEENTAVLMVKGLPWRSERVSRFLYRLDSKKENERSEQGK